MQLKRKKCSGLYHIVETVKYMYIALDFIVTCLH